MGSATVDVVVGAGSGMGVAVAGAIAGRRPLVLADRDGASAERTAAALGGDVAWVPCDTTDPADLAALARRVPKLGSLVVTAGLSPAMAEGGRIFEVNLIGMARLLHALDGAIGQGTAATSWSTAGSWQRPAARRHAGSRR